MVQRLQNEKGQLE